MTNWNALEAIRKAQEGSGPERRGAPRFACRETICGKGAVLDVSRTGLRVVTTTRPPSPDKTIGLELKGDLGKTRVGAQVAWARQIGRRQYEIGFRLVGEAGGLFRHAWNPDSGQTWVPARRRSA